MYSHENEKKYNDKPEKDNLSFSYCLNEDFHDQNENSQQESVLVHRYYQERICYY